MNSTIVFRNSIITAGLLSSAVLVEYKALCYDNYSYGYNVSHYSTQDYFSSYAKDYQLLQMKLDEISKLEDDWNGYGAKPITKSIVIDARHFIENVKILSQHISVFPTARQSIQFEFEHDDKYCEAEIFVDRIEIYAEKENREWLNDSFNSIQQASSVFFKAFDGRL